MDTKSVIQVFKEWCAHNGIKLEDIAPTKVAELLVTIQPMQPVPVSFKEWLDIGPHYTKYLLQPTNSSGPR